jgi:AcrR family transcriptional regulator
MFDNGQTDYHCPKIKAVTMKNKKDDRRTGRTQRSLRDALTELILEKRFDEITVQNVIDRADVVRSTFYAHYRDKEDLFLSGWKRLLEEVVRHIEWGKVKEGRFVPVQGLFSHVQEFHRFYRALVRSRKTDLLFKNGLDYLTKSIEDSLTTFLAGKPQTSVPIPLMSNYLASEILSHLKWWLDNDMPYPPNRMDELFHELVAPGVRPVLGSVEVDAK